MKAILEVQDEVNVRFKNVDPKTRRAMRDCLKFFQPGAQYRDAYRLGRWDGYRYFCTSGGGTFMNLMDYKKNDKSKSILEVLNNAGYEIEIDDLRPEVSYDFPQIEEDFLKQLDIVWPKGHPAEGEPIMLRPHQVEVINNFFSNHQCIQEVPTGAGKCLSGETELEIYVDPSSDFGKYLLNKVSTGGGKRVSGNNKT